MAQNPAVPFSAFPRHSPMFAGMARSYKNKIKSL